MAHRVTQIQAINHLSVNMSSNSKVIEEIQNLKNLYDKKLHSYRNRPLKLEAWVNISQKLGISDNECAQRWKSLRDRYRREYKKTQIASGSSASHFVEWEYYNRLSFLKDQIEPNTTRSNYKTPISAEMATENPLQIDVSSSNE